MKKIIDLAETLLITVLGIVLLPFILIWVAIDLVINGSPKITKGDQRLNRDR